MIGARRTTEEEDDDERNGEERDPEVKLEDLRRVPWAAANQWGCISIRGSPSAVTSINGFL